jgi:hypothetical protein
MVGLRSIHLWFVNKKRRTRERESERERERERIKVKERGRREKQENVSRFLEIEVYKSNGKVSKSAFEREGTGKATLNRSL